MDHLNPNTNLDVKVRSTGQGDVTIPIDQASAEAILTTELALKSEDASPSNGESPVSVLEDPGPR